MEGLIWCYITKVTLKFFWSFCTGVGRTAKDFTEKGGYSTGSINFTIAQNETNVTTISAPQIIATIIKPDITAGNGSTSLTPSCWPRALLEVPPPPHL
jgi:hypothetical protein